MKPIHHYCIATGTWFAAHGMQHVLFAWLVAMVLREPPGMVGVAQMALLAPVTLLMLVGGGVADVLGGRRVAVAAQMLAVVPGVGLLAALALDAVSLPLMIAYAVAMGCAVAFLTPARDSLLNAVADGRIQRTVVLVSLIQFGVQMLGFLVAGMADWVGPEAVVGFQVVVLAGGVFAYSRLPAGPALRFAFPPVGELMASVGQACRFVLRSPVMRPVVAQNMAMGVCFMGSYMVSVPLLIREVYAGGAAHLALVNACNVLGLVTSLVALLFVGDLRRPGRSLLIAHGLGSVFLAAAGLGFGIGAAAFCLYLWGVCGGVAMSMSRAIMQEAAPDGQRGRVMAFFSFSFMGAGPVGALVCGQLVGAVGAPMALGLASAALLAVVLVVAARSELWHLRGGWRAAGARAA